MNEKLHPARVRHRTQMQSHTESSASVLNTPPSVSKTLPSVFKTPADATSVSKTLTSVLKTLPSVSHTECPASVLGAASSARHSRHGFHQTLLTCRSRVSFCPSTHLRWVCASRSHTMVSLWVRASGFGFRFLCHVFRVSCFGFRVHLICCPDFSKEYTCTELSLPGSV